jgi:hypothetical protein
MGRDYILHLFDEFFHYRDRMQAERVRRLEAVERNLDVLSLRDVLV